MKPHRGYSRMNNGDDFTEDEGVSEMTKRGIFSPGTRLVQAAWNLICILVFLAGGIMILVAKDKNLSDKECAAQISIWSPLLEAVEYEDHDWVSIFATQNSGFTGTPSKEMETNWNLLIDVPSVVVPPERIPLLNRSVDQGFVSMPPTSPTQGYVAGVEVFHHLHCLNVLRQYIGRDSYPDDLLPSLFKHNSAPVVSAHVDHCIETLRLALMCNADITPYLLYEKEAAPGSDVPAREDFQAFHKCKNFDRLLDWVNTNGVVVPWRQKDRPN